VAVSALLVALLAPPSRLVSFIGSDVWARLGLGLVVFMAMYGVLIAVGLMTGKVVMPFGVSIENGGPQVGLLSEELIRFRETDERVFERLGELNQLLASALSRIQTLEDQSAGGGQPS